MVYEFFTLGSLWFWLLSAVGLGFLWFCLDHDDSGRGATITMAAFVGLIYAFGDFNPIPYIKANPWHVLTWAAVYYGAGVVWSVIKWWFYVTKQARWYGARRAKWLSNNNNDEDGWRKIAQSYTDYREFPPKALTNKARILTWMAYWPFSAVWTLINDPVRHLFEYTYETLLALLQSISDKAFAAFAVDFQKKS